MSESKRPSAEEQDRRLGTWLLVLFVLGALALLFFYVPRLTNYVMSDREFTGWSGPIGARIAAGERPYVDFVLPIPPGSFVLMAMIQEVTGESRLVHELWVANLSQLAMAVMAYAISVRFTSRTTAILVAMGTLVALMQLPKECVYDHTAQLSAWGSLLVGVHALGAKGARANKLWVATGFLAVFTMGFKQSTATGIALGWLGAMAYTVLVAWRGQGSAAARARAGMILPWMSGALMGLAAVWLLLVSVGASVPAYAQAVFGDAADLKGGSATLVWNLVGHVFRRGVFPGSLVFTLVVITVVVHIARRDGRFVIERPQGTALDSARALTLAAVLVLAVFGPILLLATGITELPKDLWTWTERLGQAPGFGLVFACAFFLGHLQRSDPSSSGEVGPGELGQRGHAFNALAIAALGSSLLHDASFSEFKFFYNNNPIIAVAFIGLFTAAAQSKMRTLTVVAVALSLAPLYGRKMNRALAAQLAVNDGHWAGLSVHAVRGAEILAASRRIQELAGPSDTVLILPEDVQLVGLVDRPRPPVRGAILFVDQYAKRLAEDDIATLAAHPPKVIVIHPRKEKDWRRLFATWNTESGAAVVLEYVTRQLLPRRYRLDSSFRTVHFWDQGFLDVYVLEN